MSEASSDNQAGGKEPFTFQFRLAHVCYAIAMLSSTLATFGPLVVFEAVVIIAFWGYVFSRRSRPRGLIEACLPALILFRLLTPEVASAPEAWRRAWCGNNLKQIALALQNYHDTYGQFPPAYVPDRNGKPMHSWRVLLLPFMEESALYAKYRFDEPWDGPNNRQLLDKIGWGKYQCPKDLRTASGQPNWTSYVAVVGPRTAWPGSRSRKMSEISDFLSNTVLVVEYQGGQIAWMEPRDLEFDEALRLFTSLDAHAAGLHPSERFFFPHYEEGPNSVFTYYAGRNAVFADRSCRFFLNGIRRDVWSALLTVDDGAELDDHDLDAPCVELRRVNLGNCFRLGLFLFLVVLPLPWVWLGRRPSQWARQPSDSEEPQ